MTRRLAILAFIALAGTASAQYSDVRIHASRPIPPNNNVWLNYWMAETQYNRSDIWFIFPAASNTGTQNNFTAHSSNDAAIVGAVFTNIGGVPSMYFDGIDDYASGLYNGGNTGSFAASVWCYNSKTLAGQTDFSGILTGPDGSSSFYILAGDNNFIRCGFRNAANQESKVDTQTFADGAVSNWLHVGFCFSDQNDALYVFTNGVLSATTSNVTATPKNDGRSLFFFGKLAVVNWEWNGAISESWLSKGICDTNALIFYYNQTRSRYGL